jgi:class 3 adenylate cyclase
MDVGGWLRGLGLGQYEEKFRDNKIDADLLPRLTVDDLKDIGVAVVGDRRRLLDAIAILYETSPPADVPAPAMKSAPAKGLQASAEGRHITVLFCDIVDSTTISAGVDAENWRNLVSAYLDAASEAVTQMGGHIARSSAMGSWRCSGARPRRKTIPNAVRAALLIQRAMAELNRKGQASGARNSSPASALRPARW